VPPPQFPLPSILSLHQTKRDGHTCIRRGARAEWLGLSPPLLRRTLVQKTAFCQPLTVHPAVNGYLTLFTAGEGIEKEEWWPTSGSLLAVQAGSPAATTQHILLKQPLSFYMYLITICLLVSLIPMFTYNGCSVQTV